MQDSSWEESLATSIERVLTPVQPTDVFRNHLRAGLQLASQQQAAARALRASRPPGLSHWWLGAAAVGVTLATGSMIAWILRSRWMSPTVSVPKRVLSERVTG